MLDISSSCRTCMKNNVSLINLFEAVTIDEVSNLQLVELLTECTALQVNKEDGLPQNVCEECTKVLQLLHTFRNQAIQSEELFKKLLEEKVKQEVKIEFDSLDHDYIEESFPDSLNSALDSEYKIEPKVLRCPKCDKTFTKENKYQKHLDSHDSNSLPCPFCNKTFLKKSALHTHLKFKHPHHNDQTLLVNPIDVSIVKTEKDDLYQCPQCIMAFNKPRSLALHMKKHERAKEHSSVMCDTCGKPFADKSLLKRHLKLHTKERPYVCEKCDKRYSRQDQWKAHMHTHKEKKTNVCPHCNKTFAQTCSLKDHIRTHTKETPYLCSECGKGFANSSNLRQHMLRHTGVKPHACKLCPKSFCTKGQMTAHMETHTGAHPYKCEKCGAAFTKPNSLKKHALLHTGHKPFGCDTCLMRFTCKDHLKRHMRIHTGEKPYKCKFCERAFTQSNDLVKHMRSHVGQNIYQCTVCSMGFRLQSELKQHYPVHFRQDSAMKDLLIIDKKYPPPNEQTHIQTDIQTDIMQKSIQTDIQTSLQTNIPTEIDLTQNNISDNKFMITINNMDGNNIVAINIEPGNGMMKV